MGGGSGKGPSGKRTGNGAATLLKDGKQCFSATRARADSTLLFPVFPVAATAVSREAATGLNDGKQYFASGLKVRLPGQEITVSRHLAPSQPHGKQTPRFG